MGASTGRDVLVEFALKLPGDTIAAGDWKTLGMMRGKSLKASWETVDTTADKSPSYTKTSLVTFKSVEFSGDGVSYDDAVHNQALLEAHVVSPPSSTNYQPMVHFRITYPAPAGMATGKRYQGPFIVSEWSNDAPHADACTWSITASSNGDITLTPAAAA